MSFGVSESADDADTLISFGVAEAASSESCSDAAGVHLSLAAPDLIDVDAAYRTCSAAAADGLSEVNAHMDVTFGDSGDGIEVRGSLLEGADDDMAYDHSHVGHVDVYVADSNAEACGGPNGNGDPDPIYREWPSSPCSEVVSWGVPCEELIDPERGWSMCGTFCNACGAGRRHEAAGHHASSS